MFDFEKPKIEIAEISEDKTYGKFVVEPLEILYGDVNYAFVAILEISY